MDGRLAGEAGEGMVVAVEDDLREPRKKMEAPMVMMIKVTTGASRACSTASFSSAKPATTAAAIAIAAAMGTGTPPWASIAVVSPPIMTNSPWAKLMTWLAL